MPSLHPRCAQHGLVVAQDGLCVLCRRQAGAVSSPDDAGYAAPLSATEPQASASGALKVITLLAALLLTAAGAAFALKWSVGPEPELQPSVASAELLKSTPDPKDELTELERAKAADLAKSLALLERAEAERQIKAKLAAAEAELQRRAAQAAREQEERERDLARHEAVMRDVEESFQTAQKRVQITMYSTEWCGVCKRARAYMQKQQIPFTELDIESDVSARARASALNPALSVPTISIDRELMIGFSPEALEQRIARATHARKL